MGLAPTTSTIMEMALGDALAVALLTRRGFTAADFRRFHPGGRLGARLKHVRELMHDGDAMPLASPDLAMDRALLVMTEKRFGCLGVTGADEKLVGIVTDGDLRRHMGPDLLSRRVGDIMTLSPQTIAPDALAAEALHVMNARERPITSLFVIDSAGRPIGVLHVHDLLRAGVA
jgi:arabinose-5-phosphate isomerase